MRKQPQHPQGERRNTLEQRRHLLARNNDELRRIAGNGARAAPRLVEQRHLPKQLTAAQVVQQPFASVVPPTEDIDGARADEVGGISPVAFREDHLPLGEAAHRQARVQEQLFKVFGERPAIQGR